MKPAFNLTLLIVSLVISLTLLGFPHTNSAYATSTFSLKDIVAGIRNISPADNGSYTGDVPLNISVRFSARSSVLNPSLIPYQEISCIYQLDNSEWRSASLYHASEQKAWWDPTFQGYWNEMDCYYSAVLQGLSNGEHLLYVDLTPDLKYTYRISTNGTLLQENLWDNTTTSFYIFGNDAPVPADRYATQEILFGLATVLTVIIIFAAVVVLRRRKRINQVAIN